METRMNATTTDGETVVIVKKEITDGSRPFTSQLLTAEDGRTFRPCGGGQVEEITVMDAGEADLDDAPAATVEETPAPDSEQAAEAPAEDGMEEADAQV